MGCSDPGSGDLVTRALIIGAAGQDGSYLAEHLAAEGTEVVGLVRRWDHPRIMQLQAIPGLRLVQGDLLDTASLIRALRTAKPDEVYNTAALLAPRGQWVAETPPLILETTGIGPARLLDAVVSSAPHARLVHVSSSAIYSPEKYGAYGAAKKLAHDAVCGYRRHAGVWASNAIFFSHTSPRQSDNFLIRRLIKAAVDIADGRPPALYITNVANRRDWGWAPDFVRALVAIARTDEPGDYVVRSGTSHSVQDVLLTAARVLGVDGSRLLSHWPNAERQRNESEPDTFATPSPAGWRHETTFPEMIKKLIEFEVNQA